jgi:hypothetical protein
MITMHLLQINAQIINAHIFLSLSALETRIAKKISSAKVVNASIRKEKEKIVPQTMSVYPITARIMSAKRKRREFCQDLKY